ncbi:hypothetical protein BDQ17DRAFT_1355741 [Cyathus striatus]|nr:hypothetical protein BDQ17DRAFT_1355741 [Cyathus striatus]
MSEAVTTRHFPIPTFQNFASKRVLSKHPMPSRRASKTLKSRLEQQKKRRREGFKKSIKPFSLVSISGPRPNEL